MIFRFATLWHWSQNSGRLLRTWRRFCQAPCQRCFLQWHLEHRNLLHHGFKLERRRGLIHRIGCTNKGDRRCKNSWIFLSRKGAPKDLNANHCQFMRHYDRYAGKPDSLLSCHVQLCRRESLSRTFYESFGNWRHCLPMNGSGYDGAKREAYEAAHTRRTKDMNIRQRAKCEFAQYFQILCRCWIRQQRAPSLKVLLWYSEARAGVGHVFWLWTLELNLTPSWRHGSISGW